MSQTTPLLRPFLLLLAISLIRVSFAQAGSTNPPAAGENILLTAAGKVEGARAGGDTWTPARVNEAFKVRDKVRTGLRSKATLRLSNQSLMQLDQLSVIEILPPAQENKRSLLDMKSGAAFFYNREAPVETEFRTPVASGAIRGTEFHLAVAENGATVLTLLDGAVDLTNNLGQVSLASGEQGIVEPGQPPRKTAVIDAINIIQWALYYPAIIDPADLGLGEQSIGKFPDSFRNYKEGDLLKALDLYPTNLTGLSPAESIYRAALLLSVGQVPQAEAALKDASGGNGRPAQLAEALRELIAAVKFQNYNRSAPPATGSEWLAESYYLQSRSDLEKARAAAREAVKMSPNFGFAWARLAEMEFSFEKIDAARDAIEKALRLTPRNAQALSLKGYLLAAENKIRPAIDYFDQAIAIDGNLGNAWLGRGLCKIRSGMDFFFLRGQSQEGRKDIQTAAILEPNRAVLRSYLGKAHENDGSFQLAVKELDLAKKQDPNDPTAWLYSALLNMQYNRLNQAVEDLEHSKELNANRRVFRSKLLLDQDQAVRGANLAAIYRDEGMVDLSVREASRAVNTDYGNFSAHLFLANSYDALRDPKQVNLRYETPWLSELLLANLLAPVGAGPLSQNISQQEYSKLFERDRLGFSSSTEYFSHGDWLQTASQFGTFGSTSYSIDTEYRTDRGYRPNNDFESFTAWVKAKEQLTLHDSIFVEGIYSDTKFGDVAQTYDNTPGSVTSRGKERQEPIVFVGYHHEWAPGTHTMALVGSLNDTLLLSDPNYSARRFPGGFGKSSTYILDPAYNLDYRSKLDGVSSEIQHVQALNRQSLVVGLRYQTADVHSSDALAKAFSTPTHDVVYDNDLWRVSAYAYDFIDVLDSLRLIGGLSYDRLHYPWAADVAPIGGMERERDAVSPKAGFIWTVARDTHFRGLYTRSLGGAFFDQSFRLEPTQLAGFNQAYRSLIPESVIGLVPGTKFETVSAGIDHAFKTKTYAAVEGEWLRSDAARGFGAFYGIPAAPLNASFENKLKYDEKNLLVTLDQLISKEWSVGARYRLTHSDLSSRFPELPPGGAVNYDQTSILHQLSLHLIWNHPSGFFAQAFSIYNTQSNQGFAPDEPGGDFWQHNFFVGYRFPRRFAEIRLGILNITDRNYKLEPLTLYNELPRERTFVASLKLNF